MKPYQTLVVGVDFSEYSREALRHGILLAKTHGAKLIVVHVCDMDLFLPLQMGSLTKHIERQDEWTQACREQLDEFIDDVQDEGVQIEKRIVMGTAYKELAHVAYKTKADLVLIGTHGRGRLEHLLLGSVAERVVRTAPCSVLAVKLEGSQPYKQK